ncbi:hypothetical protein EGW08_022447 [Elysia chlorotica]|uniref:Uncharacterized protein n=1 Tax=Elysia chlorotica TaxID=188477 RepID=A0A433SKX8_ELYCH|nr:hypothetical protein EGW08_022447 [Elysia chlorotica]
MLQWVLSPAIVIENTGPAHGRLTGVEHLVRSEVRPVRVEAGILVIEVNQPAGCHSPTHYFGLLLHLRQKPCLDGADVPSGSRKRKAMDAPTLLGVTAKTSWSPFLVISDVEKKVAKFTVFVIRKALSGTVGYQREYPCKFEDYEDMRSKRTCFKVINRTAAQQTWDMARADCKYSYYGDLYKISDAEEDSIIRGLKTLFLRYVTKSDLHAAESHVGIEGNEMARKFSVKTTRPEGGTRSSPTWTFSSYSRLSIESIAMDEQHDFHLHQNDNDNHGPDGQQPRRHQQQQQQLIALSSDDFSRLPGRPALSWRLPPGHRHPNIGFQMALNCSSLMDKHAQIRFEIAEGSYVTEVDNSSDDYGGIQFVITEDGRYVDVENRCFLRSAATMRVKVTALLFNVTISCCWHRLGWDPVCSDGLAVHPRYLPKRPVMNVLSHNLLKVGTYLIADCSACVGSDGQLTWLWIDQDKQKEWTSHFRSTDHNFFDPWDITLTEAEEKHGG